VANKQDLENQRHRRISAVYVYMINLIESGKVAPGEKLPNTDSLRAILGASTEIVSMARAILVKNGRVKVINNRAEGEPGTYVV
jgi:DNA-binding GntR family transcriptional regulator